MRERQRGTLARLALAAALALGISPATALAEDAQSIETPPQ